MKYELQCATVYVTYNFDDGKLVEVFIRIGKAGSCPGCLVQGMSRVISIALQDGTDMLKLSKTLVGMQCDGSQLGLRDDPERLTSCMDAIAKSLRQFAAESTAQACVDRIEAQQPQKDSEGNPLCKHCGNRLLAAQFERLVCTECRKKASEGDKDNGKG